MSKIRVHELAKELNVNNKEIMSFLEKKQIEVKSHMSTLEDDQADMIRKNFGGEKTAKSAEPVQPVKPEAAPKPEKKPEAKTEAKPEEHKKKASISAVYNPQYGKNPATRNGQRKTMSGTGERIQGERRPRPMNGENGERRPMRQGERRPRPENAERRPAERRPVAAAEGRPAERRPVATTEGRPVERRPVAAAEGRPTERRPVNNDGKRFASNGEKRNYNNGERPRFNKDGNNADRRSFNNNNERRNQGGSKGSRLEGEINRMNRNSEVSTEEKPKDRENKRFKSKPQKNTYNSQKEKRPENFFQLEKVTRKKNHQPKQSEDKDEVKTIVIPENLTIRELADKMKRQPSELVKKLFLQGKVVTVNQDIDFDTAEEIALEFNCICEKEEKVDVIEELLREDEEDESLMLSRPPVVCVMGHVDHGKTSLLDAIRDSHVIDREAGGITQHIGASVVDCNGQAITFLDTPGHEAFTAMRMRGANSTDIAILVVAADDGVMPQTVEAINHAKAANIEIIVAINKIDKPSANIDKVKQELSEYELIPEDWGGSTIFVPVSAHTHEGIDTLLEMVLLTAEVLELKANPNRKARGLVIEAKLDKGRGVVATLLIQKGTLRVGDPIAAGSSYGKVRAMTDSKGRRVKEAGPSTPVEIIGLNEAPGAGDIFVAMDSDKEARSFAETFISENKEKLVEETKTKMSLDDLFSQIQAGNLKELNLIVKADVQGSVEAVKQSLVKLSNEEVIVKVIHSGVGAINESDVILASASNAIIIGFNIRPDAMAKATADREGVDIRLYKVIYNAIEDVEAAMKGMLDPIFEEQVIGHAEIRQIFKASGVGNIAGSYITDGRFQRGCSVRITRDGEQIFEGPLASLKRFKDDVKEVKAGFECGLVFEGFGQIQELDIVEAYIMVEVPR
ncbi:MAG: translation initiation factor IF-2 [Lachnospiraceae bacterium]